MSLGTGSLQDNVFMLLGLEEKIKALQEDRIDLLDKIRAEFEATGEEVIVIPINIDVEAVVKKHHSFRLVLNKDKLSSLIGIAKDEFKTPFDISMLTKQGKLSPEQITACQDRLHDVAVRVRKKKVKKKGKGRR